jgi:hypothetical protein
MEEYESLDPVTISENKQITSFTVLQRSNFFTNGEMIGNYF